MAKTWQQTGKWGYERYVDDDGKILAEIEDSMTSSETVATVRYHGALGGYVSRDHARKAVERYFSAAPPGTTDSGEGE